MFRAVLLLLCLIPTFCLGCASCESGFDNTDAVNDGGAGRALSDETGSFGGSADVREIERSGLYYDYYERGTHASGDGFFDRLLNGLKNIADCLSSFIGSVRSRIGDHIESV